MKTSTSKRSPLGSGTCSPSSEIPTPPEGWIYAGHGPIKHRPNGDDHTFDVAILDMPPQRDPAKWDTIFARIGHGDAHYAVRVGSEIAKANGLVPLCASCGEPATCYGQYEDQPEGYACDDCCGHGCEGGKCHSLENDPAQTPPDSGTQNHE